MAKKVFLVTLEYPPQKGGVASYYGGLVGELRRQGHEVEIVSSGLLSKWIWPRWLRGYFTVRKLIYGGRTSGQTEVRPPDIVFVGHLLPLGTVAYLLRKRVPYVVFTHGMDVLMAQKSWRKRRLARKILEHATLVVANSEFTKQQIEVSGVHRLGGASRCQVSVVYPCPTVVPEVKSEEVEMLRRKLGLTGKKVLLTLGRIVERKGYDLVIKAMPEILQHVPEAVYVVAGDGPDLEKLAKLVEDSPFAKELSSAVRFVGAVSDAERPLYYEMCDLFVMPSRQIGPDVEGFGLSFLEAAVFGKPSIGGRSGGISEAILDGKTGALVDTSDASALARVVVQLLRDDTLRAELGQNAKARVMHEFRWERQVTGLIKALSS